MVVLVLIAISVDAEAIIPAAFGILAILLMFFVNYYKENDN